jgi:acyl-coenzyme A thioesterase PaaI-like protein
MSSAVPLSQEWNTLTENIFNALQHYAGDGISLELPPPAFKALRMMCTEYSAGRALICTAPLDNTLATSLGDVSAGFINSVLDAAFDCLAFLIARKPCEPVHSALSVIRPLAAGCGGELVVEVRLRAKSRGLIFLEGKATGPGERTVAMAGATMAACRNRD